MFDTSFITQNGLTDLSAITRHELGAAVLADTLAKINRFAGRTPEPWSVASHSVLVSRLCSNEAAGAGLLHDAHEAFLGDLITPAVEFIAGQSAPMGSQIVRNCINGARQSIDRQIEGAWGIRFEPYWAEVHRADIVALDAEMFAFFKITPPDERAGEVERALSILNDLPQGGDWRSAALFWAEEARRIAIAGGLSLPHEAA